MKGVAVAVVVAACGAAIAVLPVHATARIAMTVGAHEIEGGGVDCGMPVRAAFDPTYNRPYERAGGNAMVAELARRVQRSGCPGPARLRLAGGVALVLIAAGVALVSLRRPRRAPVPASR